VARGVVGLRGPINFKRNRFRIGGRSAAIAATLVALFAVPFMISVAGCGQPANTSGALQAKVTAGPLPERVTQMGFNLIKGVSTSDAGSNVFVSPASLELALAMTMNGAAGGTLAAMQETLKLQGLSMDEVNSANKTMTEWLEQLDQKVELKIANSLWAKKDVAFSPTFLAANKEFYGAKVESLDFSSPSAAKTINSWVSDATNGKIKEMVKPPIDAQTILLLLNAIYFKGEWTSKFEESNTKDRQFTTGGGSTKTVPMMSQTGKFRYLDNGEFQAIFLPYGAGRTGMYVFLPKGTGSLPAFVNGLNAQAWGQWMSQFSETEGDISMPRFTLEYEKALKDTLTAMGMGVAFEPDKADFSLMLKQGSADKPFIQSVTQKTFVDVNEKGTEAAAATSVQVGVTAMPSEGNHFTMVVDHPFYFVITDDAGKVVLFEGSVFNP
jgi:serpin B